MPSHGAYHLAVNRKFHDNHIFFVFFFLFVFIQFYYKSVQFFFFFCQKEKPNKIKSNKLNGIVNISGVSFVEMFWCDAISRAHICFFLSVLIDLNLIKSFGEIEIYAQNWKPSKFSKWNKKKTTTKIRNQ